MRVCGGWNWVGIVSSDWLLNIIILFVTVSAGNLETKSSEGCTDWGRCLLYAGGGEQITSIVEMSRNTEVERGAPQQKMSTYQRGSSNRKDTYCQTAAELRQSGTFAYSIKCKWENRTKNEERKL